MKNTQSQRSKEFQEFLFKRCEECPSEGTLCSFVEYQASDKMPESCSCGHDIKNVLQVKGRLGNLKVGTTCRGAINQTCINPEKLVSNLGKKQVELLKSFKTIPFVDKTQKLSVLGHTQIEINRMKGLEEKGLVSFFKKVRKMNNYSYRVSYTTYYALTPKGLRASSFGTS